MLPFDCIRVKNIFTCGIAVRRNDMYNTINGTFLYETRESPRAVRRMTMIRYLETHKSEDESGGFRRITVLFKGCSLACRWCDRPESIPQKAHALWIEPLCIGCRFCEGVCPNDALSVWDDGVFVEKKRCIACRACESACPSGALSVKGVDAEPEALFAALTDDGVLPHGVTICGGEPLLQDGAIELLSLFHQAGAETTLETNGMVFPERLERALPHTDRLIYDVKLMDDELHRRFTGHGNAMILKNLGVAARWAKGSGRLVVRTPIVENATDSIENIRRIGERILAIGGVERWELYVPGDSRDEPLARPDARMDELPIQTTLRCSCHGSSRCARMDELLSFAQKASGGADIRFVCKAAGERVLL